MQRHAEILHWGERQGKKVRQKEPKAASQISHFFFYFRFFFFLCVCLMNDANCPHRFFSPFFLGGGRALIFQLTPLLRTALVDCSRFDFYKKADYAAHSQTPTHKHPHTNPLYAVLFIIYQRNEKSTRWEAEKERQRKGNSFFFWFKKKK